MDDWATQATDWVERGVGAIRDRTVGPAQQIVKFIVYGVLVAILAITAFVLFAVLLLRLLNLFLPDWAAWLVLGVIFLAGGTLAFVFRTPTGGAGNNAPGGDVGPASATEKERSA
jgi:hypothetical protein